MRTYKIPPEAVRDRKIKIRVASLTLLLVVPAVTAAAGRFLPLDRSLTLHDIYSMLWMLGLPCALLWLYTTAMPSLQIQLEDDRITQLLNLPFTRSPRKISFARTDIAHIREVGKSGLYVHGRSAEGKYFDLHVPRSLENYDDLRSRLAAWHPIQPSWL